MLGKLLNDNLLFSNNHKKQNNRNRGSQREYTTKSWWKVEPNVGRVADGVQGRSYRLRGLGNSIVPKIAEEIGRAILKVEN